MSSVELESPLTYEHLRTKLKINELEPVEIEKELQEQAVLYEMVCLNTAKQAFALQKLKIAFDTLESGTKIEKRKYFESSGKKVTEGTIQEAVDVDANVVGTKEALAEADFEYQRWYSLKRAFEHKAEALHRIADLIRSGYLGHTRV